jgi:hypothetical protein
VSTQHGHAWQSARKAGGSDTPGLRILTPSESLRLIGLHMEAEVIYHQMLRLRWQSGYSPTHPIRTAAPHGE